MADRVGVVTGGAQGIGAAAVAALLAHGARVCVADLDRARAEEAVRKWGEDRVLAVEADLAEPGAAARVVDATVRRFGTLDVLVNNAGYYWDAPVHRMTDDQFQAMLEIHALVPFRMMREAARHLRPAAQRDLDAGVVRHRKVVNISSRAALHGLAGAANYSAGKAALLGLTYSAAKEWARLRINVNAIAFGAVRTRFGLPKDAGNVVRSGGRDVPLGTTGERPRKGRIATPEEAADTVLYLCSPLSDPVNGQVITVGG
jgi:3-oxoacyl-[acyl-carrier protein] reductase